MRLQQRTDYALRMLLHLAVSDGTPQPVGAIAAAFGVSEHHLAKVAQRLRELGHVDTVRGRSGGFVLAREPRAIGVGEVVRGLEEDFALVECFEPDGACVIAAPCRLRTLLHEARERFLEVLDAATLEDLVSRRRAPLRRALEMV